MSKYVIAHGVDILRQSWGWVTHKIVNPREQKRIYNAIWYGIWRNMGAVFLFYQSRRNVRIDMDEVEKQNKLN